MKILIVEPHFDDAWINLGGYILLRSKYRFFILTFSIYPTNKRNGTKIISKFLPNVTGISLGYNSLGFDDPYMKKLVELYKPKNYLELFLKINRLRSLKEVKFDIKKHSRGFDKVFWPLGMKHPQHILMKNINPFKKNFYYYREYPYFFYTDQKQEGLNLTRNLKKSSISIKSVLCQKIQLYEKAYPEQSFILDLKVGGKTLKDIDNELFWWKD